MSRRTAKELCEVIAASGLCEGEHVAGMNQEQISTLENKYAVRLPKAYKEWLAEFGASSSGIFYSVTFTYPQLEEAQRRAKKLASVDGFSLPESAIVFLIDDCSFCYFDATEGDDPPVYEFYENHTSATKIQDSFSDWLNWYVTGEAEQFKENVAKGSRL